MPSVPYRDKKYHRSASLRRTGSSRDRPHWVPLCRLLLRNRMHFTDSGVPARKVPLPRTAARSRPQPFPVCRPDIIGNESQTERMGYSRLSGRLPDYPFLLRIPARRPRTRRHGNFLDIPSDQSDTPCRCAPDGGPISPETARGSRFRKPRQ